MGPYSKWFGTAFEKLPIDGKIKNSIQAALSANSLTERENRIVEAQALVADMHNGGKLTDFVDFHIESYFGRDIKVIFADKFAEATVNKLKNTVFEHIPLIGSFSQPGGLSEFADNKKSYSSIRDLYGGLKYDV